MTAVPMDGGEPPSPPGHFIFGNARELREDVLGFVVKAWRDYQKRAGKDGAVLMAGTQSMLADAMAIWGLTYEVI